MQSILSWFSRSTPIGLLILGFLVGVGGALGAALFHILIFLSTTAFYGLSTDVGFIENLESMSVWQRLLIPTLGGLLVGIIYKISRVTEAEGEGVPEVMEALAHKRGNIRPIVGPIKIITAAITLGSGGSAGREGPVIQIGSAIGSSIAQLFRQATSEKSLLLAAGAAAGIGGTFGAPIAGILFTIEILHHRPNPLRSTILVLAAFTGAVGARFLTGYEGLRFKMEEIFTFEPYSIGGVLGLSVIAVFVALLFGKILNLSRTFLKNLEIPHIIKPAFGGLVIGIVGLLVPHIHEPATYPLMIDLISLTALPLTFLVLLLFIKMFATGVTLGSGGSGGIFAPLLLMGALTGSILGGLLVLFGSVPLTFVPVLIFTGMATVFAAAAHASLTAAFITYEMTGELTLLIPLLITCLIASFLAKRIKPESVYNHNM
ncbi:MAG: chloride channel protein [Candidatus Pacebacteria bacterium]|nr:chloride channel protein [Candidatus Paceibacterota bacterium]MBP9842599.1 chloride channel protein [Candidatus Paceibacterota bacterium]